MLAIIYHTGGGQLKQTTCLGVESDDIVHDDIVHDDIVMTLSIELHGVTE
jgi:hypothetical protein